MWLHKHGWHYFYNQTEAILRRMREIMEDSRNKPDDAINRYSTYREYKVFFKEFAEHLDNIEAHLQNEKHLLREIINKVYDGYLTKKIKERVQIEHYESNLIGELDKLQGDYGKLIGFVKVVTDSYNGKTILNLSEFVQKIRDISTSLELIKSDTLEMAKYLKMVLPEIEEYKEWLKKDEENADWAQYNIKSWIREQAE